MSKSKSIQDKKYECRVCGSCYPFRYIECPNCKRSGDIWELVEQSKDKRYTEKQNRLTKEDQERLLPKFRNVEQSKEEQCDSDPLGPMIYGTKPKTEDTGECCNSSCKCWGLPKSKCRCCKARDESKSPESEKLSQDWEELPLDVQCCVGDYCDGVEEHNKRISQEIESARASERKKIDTEKILRDVEEELAKSGTYKYEEIHGALMFKYRVDELLSKIEK